MKALLTIAIGAVYQDIARLTHPVLSDYARHIGADFISINTFQGPAVAAKILIDDYLAIYDRVAYVDSDIVVNSGTPDIFSRVPDDAFGAWFVNPMIPGRFADQMIRAQTELGYIGWRENYFNAGVMVVSRAHRPIFEKAKSLHAFMRHENYFEQTLLNYLVQQSRCPTVDLGFRWNHTNVVEGQDRFQSHFIHYAGTGHIPGTKRTDQIRADLKRLGWPS